MITSHLTSSSTRSPLPPQALRAPPPSPPRSSAAAAAGGSPRPEPVLLASFSRESPGENRGCDLRPLPGRVHERARERLRSVERRTGMRTMRGALLGLLLVVAAAAVARG